MNDENKSPGEWSDRPVIKAIVEIMREVGAVEKKGRNDFHKYDYATAADVAHALQKRMADAGLVIIPTQRKMEMIADGQALAIEFAFEVAHISGDRLKDCPVFTGMARARDSKGGFDDKAANKCLTAANKYFVLNLFRIPTGDYHDADADAITPPAKQAATRETMPINQSQQDDSKYADPDGYVTWALDQVDGMPTQDDYAMWWAGESIARREYGLTDAHVEQIRDAARKKFSTEQKAA